MSLDPSQQTLGDEPEEFDTTEVISDSKRRKLASKVSDEFDKIRRNDGNEFAICKYCKKKFVAGSSKGTSHLRKHLICCPERVKNLNDSAPSSFASQEFKFDQDRSRKDFAIMIVKHNYPFNMAEHEFFEIFYNRLQPLFKLVSRNTARGDVLKVYEEEKVKLYDFLDTLSCKVTLTTDIWTSDHQNFAYTCLIAHYINDNWELKKKILAYKYIEYPHDGETLFKFISDLILEWNLDKKLFSMVVDNAGSNDVMVRILRTWLSDKSLLYLDGKLFHVRCSAHILNLVVQDGLEMIGGLIKKIQDNVRYLNKSSHGKQKFDHVLIQLKLQGKKKVPMDVPIRWNSTFEMLETAILLKDAFSRLELVDRNYKHNPSEEEWWVAMLIQDSLQIFFEATKHFSGTKFPTSNVFFPDMCEIKIQMREWETSEHECLRSMVGPMKEKFEKYWEDCNMVLAVALVLDPRFKMDLVEYNYGRIYGIDANRYVERVRGTFFDLFDEYMGDSSSSMVDVDVTHGSNLLSSVTKDKFSGFGSWYMRARYSTVSAFKKSEIEEYLETPMLPRTEHFDILQWWKLHSGKFPILSKMARDILAVPATTITSEAAFSVGGRVIDESRAFLLPEIVEALVTANDWIPSLKETAKDSTANSACSRVLQILKLKKLLKKEKSFINVLNYIEQKFLEKCIPRFRDNAEELMVASRGDGLHSSRKQEFKS